MEENGAEEKVVEEAEETHIEGNCIKSWETYKILNKIKVNVHQKRRIARDVYVDKKRHNFRSNKIIGGNFCSTSFKI